MKRFGLHSQFVFLLLFLFTTGIGNSHPPPLPFVFQITVGAKKIVLSQERINTWQKKVAATAARGGTSVSSGKVAALAKEFGLMDKTITNPGLVFLTADITYWEKRELDANRLALEFAARRLILEEADVQGIRIPGKQALANAAEQVIPIISEQQKEEQSSLVEGVVCSGHTSKEFVQQSWEALTNNPTRSLLCTDKTIKKWTGQADDLQAKAIKLGCSDPPPASDLKPYSATYWALSDVATSWFIRGEVFSQQKKWPEAKAAYKTVIDKYRCAFTWDPEGHFWRTADGAQEKYDEIRLK